MTILIVDDETHIRLMMRLTLEACGYTVEEAATGEEGLARYARGGVDLVVLDQKMPGIDGLETLRRLNADVPGACVLMVTAFASIELAVDAMKLGASDFLRKPMTPETLRSAVAAALAGRPTARRPARSAAQTGGSPQVQTLTLNGFQILRARDTTTADSAHHVFHVKRHAGGEDAVVTVTIDPAIVARVDRLSRRALAPGGGFWRDQAERLLAAYLWSEGQPPEGGQLTVRDVSREDVEAAASWPAD